MFTASISDKVHYHYLIDDNSEFPFQDNLTFDVVEFTTLDKEELQNQLQQKYNEWLVYVTAPKEEPTEEALQIELDYLIKLKAEIEAKEQEVRSKLDQKGMMVKLNEEK